MQHLHVMFMEYLLKNDNTTKFPKSRIFYHIYLHTLNGIKIKVDNKDNLKKSNHLTFTLLSKLYYIKRKQN